jgi:AraC family transcriptional regulator
MFLRIDTVNIRQLVGYRRKMSLMNNRTAELWRSFMMRRKEISTSIGTDLYSMQIYNSQYFSDFNSATEFEKWAVTEVSDFNQLPAGMEAFTLPAGLYAVFLHKGPASDGAKTFQYIFATWLPQSEYVIDTRPHFEVLGKKYKNEDPDSEEEIWIPVRKK